MTVDMALLWSVELDLPKFGRPGIPVLLFTGSCAPRPVTVGLELSISAAGSRSSPEHRKVCTQGARGTAPGGVTGQNPERA